MKTPHHAQGFTTIELLIAMIIATLFLVTIYQLYAVTVGDSAEVRNRTNASAAAYEVLRSTKPQPQSTCTTVEPKYVTPSLSVKLPAGSTAEVAMSCPYGEGVAPTKIQVKITYGPRPEQKVIYAAYQAN